MWAIKRFVEPGHGRIPGTLLREGPVGGVFYGAVDTAVVPSACRCQRLQKGGGVGGVGSLTRAVLGLSRRDTRFSGVEVEGLRF